ncbi:Clp protease N-terminal domain-containing protein [uncultured Paludibaculum sp.]|uniref:Clp protease N-terminal domain-containing protein n=1 Tax=uncultured Paludibaculum sp. TaxID=1765020 RepID=UPI002AABC654|nr:Clp protease N-terminal domain-containing protein [uncultured Paludibaculum sp.]
MFERFTEKARRVIFFGRYEASELASGFIETEHLLLGLLREDPSLVAALPYGADEAIRQRVSEKYAKNKKGIETSVDLPLSNDARRALTHAAEESERLGHKYIETGHLVLGLLRMEGCLAAKILGKYGIEPEQYRESIRDSLAAKVPSGERLPIRPRAPFRHRPVAAAALEPAVQMLAGMVTQCAAVMDNWDERDAAHRLKRRSWTRKEALGYLVDWADIHQLWIARALTEPTMVARLYPQEEWVGAQQFRTFPWSELVDLWVCLNRLLTHSISYVPEAKLATPCKIGLDEPISLQVLIERYVKHCEDEMGQILTHG